MNWADWYTDTVDVYRAVPYLDGGLTRQRREQVLSAVPCRVYRDNDKPINMTQQAANIDQDSKLACDISVDIRPGDELILHRGAKLGYSAPDTRAFAGEPHYQYEPFGAVIPGLAHQEIRLLQEERVKNEPQTEGGTA